MKKSKNEWGYKIALCTAGYGLMSEHVIIPIVREIYGAFPDSSVFMRNFILSGSGMIALVVGLLSGLLMRKISKRNLLILGSFLFTIGGVGGAFAQSMEFLAFTRIIDAVSDGILTSVTATIIISHWQTRQEQAQMFSLYNLTSNIFGILMSVATGYLAVYGWRYAFLTHLITVVSPIMCIVFVYDDEERVAENSMEKEKKEDYRMPTDLKFSIPLIMGFYLVFYLVTAVACMPSYLVDLLVAEKGFGNSVVSGWLNAVLTASGIVSYACSSAFFMKFGTKKFGVSSIIGIMVSLFLYGIGGNVILMGCAQFMNGFFSSWLYIEFQLVAAELSLNRSKGLIMAACTNSGYVSAFIATYIPSALSKILGVNTMSSATVAGGILMLVLLAGFDLMLRQKDKINLV